MGDYGIIVALPGYDARTATPEQCALHSKFNSPKIDTTKDHFLTFLVLFNNDPPDPSAGSTLETTLHTMPHGYDYVPQTWLHVDYDQDLGGSVTPQFGPGEAFLASEFVGTEAFVGAKADAANLYVYVRKFDAFGSGNDLTGMSCTIRVYIFAETAIAP